MVVEALICIPTEDGMGTSENSKTKMKESQKTSNEKNDCIGQCIYMLEKYGSDAFNECVSDCEKEKHCGEK